MKTLKTIITFLIIYFSFFISANAQIVYTDIYDDTCSTYTSFPCSYNLDLNNDGTPDFAINLNIVIHSCPCGFATIGLSQITLCADSGNKVTLNIGLPSALNVGTIVDFSSVSSVIGCPFISAYTTTHCQQGWCAPGGHQGNWGGYPYVDHYLGLMINTGSANYFGWARLGVYGANAFTIKDYAYNSIPNQYILAGDTGTLSTGIIRHTFTQSHIKISPNPFSNSTTISFSLPQSQNVSLKIFDVNGRLIKTLADNTLKQGQHQVVWNVNDVQPGIYYLQIQTPDFVKTEKLIVTK
ncbi:MAG: T9SS type A sorting domain-containing protein [Bacteroidia bacterium]